MSRALLLLLRTGTQAKWDETHSMWVKAFNLGNNSFTEEGTEEGFPTPLPNRVSTEGLRFLYDSPWAQFAFCDRKTDFRLLSKHLWSKTTSPYLPAPGAARMGRRRPPAPRCRSAQRLAPSAAHLTRALRATGWNPAASGDTGRARPQAVLSARGCAGTPPQDPQLPARGRGWPVAPARRSHSDGAAGGNGATTPQSFPPPRAPEVERRRPAPHCGSSALPQPAAAPSPLPALSVPPGAALTCCRRLRRLLLRCRPRGCSGSRSAHLSCTGPNGRQGAEARRVTELPALSAANQVSRRGACREL